MRTKLTEKEKRARRRREALIDLGIFALLCLGACTPDLDGIGEQARKEAEANKTEVILEVNEEVEEISTEEEKPPQIENEEVEEVEEVSEVEEGETEESSEEQILETEDYPQEVEIVTEDYTFTATIEEAEEVDPDHADNMAAALSGEVEAYEETPEIPEEVTEEVQEEAESSSENGLVYLGVYEITAYEWTGNPCANGNYPTEGYTVACNSLPFGTVVYIEGIGYRTVEDRGADWHSSTWIDLYLGDESACYSFGRQYLNVYIVE